MAYAGIDDVRARAGRLAGAFTVTGQRPNETDLTAFLADVAAEIDAAIDARGFTPASLDAGAQAALKDLNAYGALMRGLEGLAPSAEVERVLARASLVWAGLGAIQNGTHPAFLVLEAGRGGSRGSSAGDMWSEFPTEGTAAQRAAEVDQFGEGSLLPTFEKGQPL